jgi:NADH-quinone oxidoreductase subunit N
VDVAALNFQILAPLGFVAFGAMAVLMGEVWLSRGSGVPERIGPLLALVTVAVLAMAIYTAAVNFAIGTSDVFNPAHAMLRIDPYSSFAIVAIAIGALLSVALSVSYLPALHIDHGEYYALLLLSVLGMFVMVASVDLMSVFMGLELMSVPIYVLVGFDRRKLRSNEAGLKYFLVGAFASAILLYGMALLYGATGATSFAGIRAGFDPSNSLAMAGLGLLIAGFAFKVSAVPFHQWTPDAYEGAPTSVTAFMSVCVKIAAFVTLLRFLGLALPGVSEPLRTVLAVLAAATMVVGNVMAVIQPNLKRMLAYSSIAHAGYALVALATASPEGYSALLFHLLVYLFMNIGAFGLIVAVAHGGRDSDRIDDFAGLARTKPGLAFLMTLFMLSLAGIPGTAGFMAKFYLFRAAVNADLVPLAILGMMTSVVSVFYYLRVPVVMYMREGNGDEPREADAMVATTLVLCAAVVLWLGLLPNADPIFGTLRVLDIVGIAAGALIP